MWTKRTDWLAPVPWLQIRANGFDKAIIKAANIGMNRLAGEAIKRSGMSEKEQAVVDDIINYVSDEFTDKMFDNKSTVVDQKQ